MARTQDFELPELILPPAGDGFQIGIPKLRWQGKDLELPTLTDESWVIRVGDDQIPSVTLRIPVRIVTEGS